MFIAVSSDSPQGCEFILVSGGTGWGRGVGWQEVTVAGVVEQASTESMEGFLVLH